MRTMKMHRALSRFALLAAAAFLAGAASAVDELPDEYLYFMLGTPLTYDNGGGTLSADDYSFVMVAMSDDGETADEYLNLYGGGGTAQGTALASGSDEPVYAALGGSLSPEDSILFEFWLESPEGSFQRVAYHSAIVGDSLADYIASANRPVATPYVIGTVTAVPEPTSGMLVLWGLAGLALRRKRVLKGVRDEH